MSSRRVVLLGAPQTGKSWLAQALSVALNAIEHPVQPDGTLAAQAPTELSSGLLAPVGWTISKSETPPSAQEDGTAILVMGMDWPGTGPAQQRADSELRQTLSLSNIPFRVVYGAGLGRLNNALLALGLPPQSLTLEHSRNEAQFHINKGRDVWQCNDCSDPDCEHKLFTSLIGRRAL